MKVVVGVVMLLAATPALASLDRYEVTPGNIATQRIPLRVEAGKGVQSFDAVQFRVVAATGPGPAVDSLGAWSGNLSIPNDVVVPMRGYQNGDSLSWTFSVANPVPPKAIFSVIWVSSIMPSADYYQIQLAAFAPNQRQPARIPSKMLAVGLAGLMVGSGVTIAFCRVRRRRASNTAYLDSSRKGVP